jgi:hypothetical protein
MKHSMPVTGIFTLDEKKALQHAGKIFLGLSHVNLIKALQHGVLLEIDCEKQNH